MFNRLKEFNKVRLMGRLSIPGLIFSMVERVTSLEVAKRAGVSQSAVSRVYTPGASVSAKTAARSKPPRRNEYP